MVLHIGEVNESGANAAPIKKLGVPRCAGSGATRVPAGRSPSLLRSLGHSVTPLTRRLLCCSAHPVVVEAAGVLARVKDATPAGPRRSAVPPASLTRAARAGRAMPVGTGSVTV